MGLFSDITSALGSVGNALFGSSNNNSNNNDNNDPTKKKQNNGQAVAPLVSQKINMPKPIAASKPLIPLVAPQANTSNLTAQPTINLPNQANSSVVVPKTFQTFQNPITPGITPVPGSHVTGSQTLEDLAGMPAGAALGTLRAGEGAIQGIASLPDLAARGVGALGIAITGKSDVNNPVVKLVNRGTNDINTPINWLAKKTDQAAIAYGPGSQDVYKPAQIAGNVLTGVDAVDAGIGKAGDVINAIKGADKVPDDIAPTEPDNIPPETGTKGPGETKPTNAPAGETAEPTPTPGATETGVKPVTPSSTSTPLVTPELAAIQNAEQQAADASRAQTNLTNLGPASPSPPVANEQAAVQNAVDQAAKNVPTPVGAPVAAVPAEAPAQAASDALAAKEAPEQQVVANEVSDEPAYKRKVPGAAKNTLPKDTPNVTFKETPTSKPTEKEPASPLGVDKLPVNKEEDTVQPAKTEKGIVKAESLETRASKLGAPGREFVQRATNARVETSRLLTQMRDGAKSFFDLNKNDQKEAWEIQEGKIKSSENTSPKVLQAVQDLKTLMPKIQQEATQAGIKVADRGPDYMPHIFEKGYLAKNFNKVAQHLVENGEASNTEEAMKLLNSNRDYMGGRMSSNLVKEREVNLPGYKTDSDALDQYFQGASKSIAQAHQFGVNNEEIAKLIDRANTNGQDGKALADIFNKYWNPDHGTTGGLGKVSTVALKAQNLLQLQKSFITHMPQGLVNIGSKYGITNYGKGLIDQMFSSEDRAYIHDAGGDAEEAHDTSGTSVKNPFNRALQFVRRLNRGTAFVTGKNIAENLASKGDETRLRSLGVTGDLVKDDSGKINLTEAQKYQASHYVADKTIFTNDPIQSSSFVQGNAGKFFGQYRGQYVFKQSGFINNLLKQAAHGNPLPALRYLGLATAGGVAVTGLKQLFEGKNPITQTKNDLKSEIEQVASNSGVESAGAGGAEDITNEAEYHTPNETAQNIAGTVSPSAGNVVETGQNIDNALRGNKNPLIKQVSSFVPGGNAILNSRVGKIAGYKPTTPITSEEQNYFNKYTPAYNKLMNTINPFNKSATNQNTEITNTIKGLTSNDHNAQGQMIQKSPAETQAQWTTIAGLPANAQNAYIEFQKSLPNHSPAYDLTGDGTIIGENGQPSTASKFQIYATYEKDLPGSAERSQLEANNPWLTQTFAAEQALYNSSGYKSTSVPYNGPLPGGVTLNELQYPNLSSQQNDLMTQETQLSSIPAANRTAAQITQLTNIENNPELQKAYTALDNYTNAQRVARGAPPLKLSPNASPAVQAGINAYDALPQGNGPDGGSPNRDAWILAHPALYAQMQNYYASADLASVSKGGAENELQGNAPSQSFLGAAKSLGTDDIATSKNANGTTSYTINPAEAYAQSGSGSGSESASAAAYDRDKAAGFSDDDYKIAVKAKTKGLKTDTTAKYKAPKLIEDKAPTGKNGNPFAQVISYTKGVKANKGANPFGNKISAVKGSKVAG